MTTWEAVLTSKRGQVTGRFDIDDVAAYAASCDKLFTKLGPRVWVDADGARTVLQAKGV